MEHLIASDAVVVHGGGVLTSPTRSRLWEFALIIDIAKTLGKTVLLRSHQFGPYTHPDDEQLASKLLSQVSFATSRDALQSSAEAKRVCPTSPVLDRVDDAFFIRLDHPEEKTLKRYRLRKEEYLCIGYRFNPAVGIGDDTYPQFAELVDIASRRVGLPAVLVPQGPFDIPTMEILASHMKEKARIIRPVDRFRDPIVLAGNAKITMAIPHHTLLFALRGAVPIISPVKDHYYLFKNKGSMRYFDMEDHVFDLNSSPTISKQKLNDILDHILSDYDSCKQRIVNKSHHLRKDFAPIDREFVRILRASKVEKAPLPGEGHSRP